MKLIIDSANIIEIENVLALGISSGITTNPSILNKEDQSRYDQIEDLLKFKNEEIYVQLIGIDVTTMYEDYKNLKTYFKNEKERIIFKIPIHEVGLKVINRIIKNNPKERILGTMIYSFSQAVTAILAGCESLAIYYNRIKVSGGNANNVIKDTKTYINLHHTNTKIIGASFKNVLQIEEALLHGADTCTIAPYLFKEMYFNEYVERDAKNFEKDHNELMKKQIKKV